MTVLNTEIPAEKRELTPDECEVVCGGCNTWVTGNTWEDPCASTVLLGNYW